MSQYIYKRILLAVPTVFGVTVLIFLAMRVLPGDPLSAIYGEDSIYILTEQELQAARDSLGLNRPLPIQYLDWMGDVFTGDLGTSFWRDKPIGEMVRRRGVISAEIAVLAVALSWVIGLPIGFIGATRRNSSIDYIQPDSRNSLAGHPIVLAGAELHNGLGALFPVAAYCHSRPDLGRSLAKPANGDWAGPCHRDWPGRANCQDGQGHAPRGVPPGLRQDRTCQGPHGEAGRLAAHPQERPYTP